MKQRTNHPTGNKIDKLFLPPVDLLAEAERGADLFAKTVIVFCWSLACVAAGYAWAWKALAG